MTQFQEKLQRHGREEDRMVVWTENLRENLRTREDKVTTPRYLGWLYEIALFPRKTVAQFRNTASFG